MQAIRYFTVGEANFKIVLLTFTDASPGKIMASIHGINVPCSLYFYYSHTSKTLSIYGEKWVGSLRLPEVTLLEARRKALQFLTKSYEND